MWLISHEYGHSVRCNYAFCLFVGGGHGGPAVMRKFNCSKAFSLSVAWSRERRFQVFAKLETIALSLIYWPIIPWQLVMRLPAACPDNFLSKLWKLIFKIQSILVFNLPATSRCWFLTGAEESLPPSSTLPSPPRWCTRSHSWLRQRCPSPASWSPSLWDPGRSRESLWEDENLRTCCYEQTDLKFH